MLEIPQEIKQVFTQIGLDRAESQVYIALLKKNFLSIQELTNEVKLPRSSVHLACENLLAKGVLRVSKTGKRRDFYIENPKNIESFIQSKEYELIAQKTALTSVLPKLSAIQAVSQESEPIEIQELQGEDGFVETFYQSLNQKKGGEVLRFAGDPEKFTVARDRLKKYREDRVKKKIYTRLLQPQSPYAEEEIKDALGKMREVRILPKELYNPSTQMSVWGDKTAITVWDKGLHSVVITNKALASTMKQLFEIAWIKAGN